MPSRRFPRAAACAALIACLVPVCALASVRLDLDGVWSFRTDPSGVGVARRWAAAMPDGVHPVTVPSSWNASATGAPDADYTGIAWYFRDLTLPLAFASLHLDLHFDATFSRSTVWVNGVEAGHHEGGYTAYQIDVSHLLHAGANRIAVAIDNRPGFSTIPGFAMRQRATGSLWYDWWRNGGIVRDVWLDVAQGGLIRRQRIDSHLSGQQAGIDDQVLIDNVTAASATYRIGSDLFAPDGTLAAHAESRLIVPAGATAAAPVTLHVNHPVLWNVGAARLYRLVSTLRDETGLALDSRADTIGLRRIEIVGRHLLVNGSRVRLSGISRHEDSPWEGLAESRGTIEQDWNDLAALHTTLTRPVHYPQPQAVLDQADRDGILLIPEIPVWQMSEAQLADPALRANAQRMMTEMIEQDGNHPSIMAWSVCNESDARRPGGTDYVRGMKRLINRLDPGRFVTFADSDVAVAPWTDAPVLHDVDFIMANAYFGSWDGAADGLDPWLDFMDKTYADKMVVISEFGWMGAFSPDRQAADRDRIANIDLSLNAFERRDFIAGAILWSYQDYRSPRNLSAGLVDGYVDHGLVDQNRQRKPSYAAWEQRNRPLSIDAHFTGSGGPSGFTATLRPNAASRIPSYPMPGYRLRWRMAAADGTTLGQGNQALATLSDTAVIVDGHWPTVGLQPGGTLRIAVLTPADVVAAEATLTDTRLRIGSAPFLPPIQEPPR